MPPTSSFPLIDRLFDGHFAEWLQEARAAGESFEAIARRLAAEHDIEVTGETIRRWCGEVVAS